MKIEFTDEQLTLVKEVLAEYAEICYQEMFDYKRVAVDADDKFIADEYNALAETEEARFQKVKGLLSYIERYEALMRDV